jgi:hypothetical protein
VVARTVRDLIEAGLSELGDAVVAMDLVVAGSVFDTGARRVTRRIHPQPGAWTAVQMIALRSLLVCFVQHDACPGDG